MHERRYEYGYSDNTIIELTARNTIGLLFLTLAYFIVEIVINYTIYSQLAWSSNRFTIEVMEVWGRAVTGIGIALILSKLYFSNKQLYTNSLFYEAPKSTFVVFIICCLFTVPASFWVQGLIIDKIVDNSDEQSRNTAILAVATKNTLVPYYDTSLASYPTGNLEMDLFDKAIYPFRSKEGATSYDYIKNESLFMKLASECGTNAETVLGVRKPTDKAFFAYASLSNKANESTALSLVDKYYRCLYLNDEYLRAHSKSMAYPIKPLEDMYNNDYIPASDRYVSALRSVGSHNLTISQVKQKWRDGIAKELGFESDIQPKLGFDAFVKNADIKRSYLSRIENADPKLYPFDDALNKTMRAVILKDLPASAVPSYRDASGALLGSDSSIEDSQALKDGKQAYKAIVMPIVGLAMSAFFLISNLIISGCSIINRIWGKHVAVAVLAGLTVWLLLAPILAGVFFDSGIALKEQGYLIKWVYYHENNLSKLYAWFV